MQRNLWIILLFPVIILGAGFTLYYVNFHRSNLSSIPQDWGSYGSYFTSFVNLSNLCVVIYFSYLVYQYNRNKDREFRSFQQAIQNPVLTFKTTSMGGTEMWQIVNVGSGAALNLQVSYKSDRNGDWIGPLVKCYSLGKGDSIDLDWFAQSPDVIGVHYKDIFGNEFVSIVGNDVSEARPFITPFDNILINGKSYGKEYFDKMLLVPAKRLNTVRNVGGGISTSSLTTESTKRE